VKKFAFFIRENVYSYVNSAFISNFIISSVDLVSNVSYIQTELKTKELFFTFSDCNFCDQ
jgi:hypothetical protein